MNNPWSFDLDKNSSEENTKHYYKAQSEALSLNQINKDRVFYIGLTSTTQDNLLTGLYFPYGNTQDIFLTISNIPGFSSFDEDFRDYNFIGSIAGSQIEFDNLLGSSRIFKQDGYVQGVPAFTGVDNLKIEYRSYGFGVTFSGAWNIFSGNTSVAKSINLRTWEPTNTSSIKVPADWLNDGNDIRITYGLPDKGEPYTGEYPEFSGKWLIIDPWEEHIYYSAEGPEDNVPSTGWAYTSYNPLASGMMGKVLIKKDIKGKSFEYINYSNSNLKILFNSGYWGLYSGENLIYLNNTPKYLQSYKMIPLDNWGNYQTYVETGCNECY